MRLDLRQVTEQTAAGAFEDCGELGRRVLNAARLALAADLVESAARVAASARPGHADRRLSEQQ